MVRFWCGVTRPNTAPATTAFDAVQLNATAGVASLLSNVNVFGGCGEYVETGSAAAR